MRREIRYAVVFNGGVSLAVWMGGVTHELNLARLASEDVADGDDQAVLEAWNAILDASDRTVAIDLVAGTSAGGLNGSLLATAVARGGDLPPMRNEWRRLASLDAGCLIRDYGSSEPTATLAPTSILNGDYFTDSIKEVFDKVKRRPRGDGFVPRRDCSLLVTATALKSPPTTTLLENGAKLKTVDGRRVYSFNREGDDADSRSGASTTVNDFQDQPDELHLAARASASFPLAFSPVFETAELARCRHDEYGTRTQTWLADGGLLDNAPFEPILDALIKRRIDRPFTRALLYVTPGVDAVDGTAGTPITPSLANSLGWVVSAIREPDQRLDRDALVHTFELMSAVPSQPFVVLSDYLRAPTTFMQDNRVPLADAAATLFDRYQDNRARALREWLISVSGSNVSPLTPPATEASGVLADSGALRLFAAEVLPESGAVSSIECGLRHTWGVSTADRLIRSWGRALNQLPDAADNSAVQDAMTQTGEAQSWTSDLWDDLVSAVRGGEVSIPIDDQMLAMKRFYFGGEDTVASKIEATLKKTAEMIAEAVDGVTATDLIALSLNIEVVSGVFYWGADEYDTQLFHYANLTPAQDPIVDLGCVGTKSDWPNRKLYGERWGHFGAFSSPEHRDHDWLWGRIDGASQISDQLLSHAPAGVDTNGLRTRLLEAILDSERTNQADVVRGAEIAYETNDSQMVLDLLGAHAPSGKTAVKNLMQTLILLKLPTGLWMRVATVCLMPMNPHRVVAAWPAVHRFPARFAWCVTYLPRQGVLWWGYRRLQRRFQRASQRKCS